MKKFRIQILLGVVFLAGLLLTFATVKEPENFSNSSYNSDPKGTKALYLLLENTDREVLRFQEKIFFIKEKCGTLLLINPEGSFSKEEAATVKDWVGAGNTLVYFVDGLFENKSDKLLSAFNISVERFSKKPENPELTAVLFNDKVKRLEAEAPLYFTTGAKGPKLNSVLLLEQKNVMVSFSFGKGTVYLSSAAGLMLNSNIAQSDNAIFLYNFIFELPGPVYFEEYHNGFESSLDPFTELKRSPVVKLLFLQLLLAGFFFLYQRGRRKRPPVIQSAAGKRSVVEYVISMGNLFMSAKASLLVLNLLRKNFKAEIASYFRKTNILDTGLLDAVKKRTPAKNSRIMYYLTDSNFLQVTNIQLIKYAREMEELKREVKANDRTKDKNR
ncbi:MAG: hypothetical protein A2231_01930 [Candidatus Firestonebacteria bacterium RIFOXYA2_FULL_40_8]|nr:MAG: hypothetical protein A2231_01930 [Candidatus Firestonebacteria bacterium RIFOXYA2_FULL_40_8]